MGNYYTLAADTLRATATALFAGRRVTFPYCDINRADAGQVPVDVEAPPVVTMSLSWTQVGQLSEVQKLYSSTYDNKDQFPWDVRNELGALLYEHEFNTESSPQAKSAYLNGLTKHIDELEQENPVMVESFASFRELFKRRKTELYDLLAESIEMEKSVAMGASSQIAMKKENISSSISEEDSEMSLDEEHDIPEEFVDGSDGEDMDEYIETPAQVQFVPLDVTMNKLEHLIAQQ